jgi:hypothetical protein
VEDDQLGEKRNLLKRVQEGNGEDSPQIGQIQHQIADE